MTRTLCIIRHADAEDSAPRDQDRRLTKAGLTQARQAGQWLERQGLTPDRVAVSTARRTRETAVMIQEVMGFPATLLQYDEAVYNGTANALLGVCRDGALAVKVQFIVGHNPGVSELAHQLVPGAPGLGKAEIIVVELELPDWTHLGAGIGKQKFVFRPDV